MDCTTCPPTGPRPDKPHTFLMHERSRCSRCNTELEARLVSRDGAIVALKLCVGCGPEEELISDDSTGWLNAFLARGTIPPDLEGTHIFKRTTSTCPTCLALVEADVVIRSGKVYFSKQCKSCGPTEALVSESADYYVRAYSFARAGTQPHHYHTEVADGCPTDCGLCGDHEQHTCLPIIEITDHCNLECPVCIVNNQYANHLEPDAFRGMIETLIAHEGQCESVALSGGEPTSHPRLLELIDIATRPEIGRVVVITNGLRLGRDRVLAAALKERGVYVALQIDGFSPETHEALRGRDLCDEKAAALKMIAEFELPTQLIFVAARGVNEHQIGQAVDLLLSAPWFLSLNFQPVAFTGFGGGRFPHNPMDRLTIPGVARAIEEQTFGRIKMSDIYPLPCSHPQCVSLTYLLRLNNGEHIPFARFVDFMRHGTLLRSSATLGASPEIHDSLMDVIHDVFAREDEIERAPEILKALRRTMNEMFPDRPVSPQEAVRIGEGQAKSIFIHHYMDRHDFDLERLRKCCHHYPQVDGRIMPACGFNMFHRGAATGPDAPLPSWGKKPWTTDAPVRLLPVLNQTTRQALTGRGPHETPATFTEDV